MDNRLKELLDSMDPIPAKLCNSEIGDELIVFAEEIAKHTNQKGPEVFANMMSGISYLLDQKKIELKDKI